MFQPFWENQSQARAQGIDGYSTVYNIHSSNSRFVRVVNNWGDGSADEPAFVRPAVRRYSLRCFLGYIACERNLFGLPGFEKIASTFCKHLS